MKLRSAILIPVLCITFFSILFTGLFLININYNFYLTKEIDDLFREAENLSNTIENHYLPDIDMELQGNFSLFNQLRPALINKREFFLQWEIHFDLFQNDTVLFSLKRNPIVPEEVKRALNGKKAYIIRTDNNKTSIFIALPVFREYGNIALAMSKDITSAKHNNKMQFYILSLFMFVSVIILIPLIYILSGLISNPIIQLIEKIKKYKNSELLSDLKNMKIDEIRELHNQFNVLIEEIDCKIDLLKEESKTKEIFIDKLNHELYTPITAIKGFAELLIQTPYNKDLFNKGLTHIQRESIRISNLNSNMQNLLLPKDDHRWEILSIKMIINEAWNSLEHFRKIKKISIEINFNFDQLRGNKELIFTLFRNLLENSIKASFNNSRIYICDKFQHGIYTISIEDSGIGIPEKDFPYLKEPYFTGSLQKPENKNKGLGLSICCEIMSYHNGSIDIKSNLPKGTTVFLDFTNILHFC